MTIPPTSSRESKQPIDEPSFTIGVPGKEKAKKREKKHTKKEKVSNVSGQILPKDTHTKFHGKKSYSTPTINVKGKTEESDLAQVSLGIKKRPLKDEKSDLFEPLTFSWEESPQKSKEVTTTSMKAEVEEKYHSPGKEEIKEEKLETMEAEKSIEAPITKTPIVVEERPSRRQRMIKISKDVAKFSVSSFVRLGIEMFTYQYTGMPGLLGMKVAQLAYDMYQGNQRMFISNAKQLVEASTLYLSTPQAYAAIKAAELGLDICRKDWIGAIATIAKILPNDTLTIAATVNNPDIRNAVMNSALNWEFLQNYIYALAATQNPLFEVFKAMAEHDTTGRYKALIEHIIALVQKQQNVISIK